MGFGNFIEYSDKGFGGSYRYSEDGVCVFFFIGQCYIVDVDVEFMGSRVNQLNSIISKGWGNQEK